jgi:DNA-binding transcriptional ArsR family regulator
MEEVKKIKGKIEISVETTEAAKILKALGHPVRLYIIQKLSKMNACCYSGDLVDEIPVGRSTLSQLLKELKHAGLIQGEVELPYIKYCLNQENWKTTRKLLNDLLNQNL